MLTIIYICATYIGHIYIAKNSSFLHGGSVHKNFKLFNETKLTVTLNNTLTHGKHTYTRTHENTRKTNVHVGTGCWSKTRIKNKRRKGKNNTIKFRWEMYVRAAL